MNRLKKILMFLPAVLLAGSCAFAAGKTITLKGSTTVLPIAQATAEAFMQKNAEANLSVQGGGSGVGISSLIDKSCDIGDSSRPIKEDEVAKAVANGVDPKANVIAMDGIGVIVNSGNQVNALTKKQIKDIFTGKISDWSQLGGTAGKIVVISRDSSSGTFEAFGGLVLNNEKVRADALMEASNQAVASTVEKTPGAIGYVGLGFVSKSVKALVVNGIEINKETVLTGKYPIGRPLFMYTNGKPDGILKEYIDFVLSADGQKIVEDQGYVAINR